MNMRFLQNSYFHTQMSFVTCKMHVWMSTSTGSFTFWLWSSFPSSKWRCKQKNSLVCMSDLPTKAEKMDKNFQRVTGYNAIEGTVLPKNSWEPSRGCSWEEGGEVKQGQDMERRDEEERNKAELRAQRNYSCSLLSCWKAEGEQQNPSSLTL